MASFDNEHTRGIAIALAAGALASFLEAHAVAAPPQILGLVATAEPTPLSCADGVCGADFSSFCLQEEKPVPTTGTEYRAVEQSDIALIYTRADGTTETVDVGPYVAIDSRRSYAAVRITLPETLIEALGAETAQLRIGRFATAVPAALADDPSPAAAAEIAAVTGPLRRLAEQLFDPASEQARAAAEAMRLVNLRAHAPEREQALYDIHHAHITQANMRVWDGLAQARAATASASEVRG